MTKKLINQNAKFVHKLINIVEPKFFYNNQPINRIKNIDENQAKNNKNKKKCLKELENKINTIDNCKLRTDSKNIVFGEGNIDSEIMLIGESPGKKEEDLGLTFQGEVGNLLNKMLRAINIDRRKVYLTYSVNFRTPGDRKPTSQEIKRYSNFLKEHIDIINPKIVILLGSSAMEAATGIKGGISVERGKWKQIILKNRTLPFLITFSPSYLIRFPENKKYSWLDLKNVRQKIEELSIKV